MGRRFLTVHTGAYAASVCGSLVVLVIASSIRGSTDALAVGCLCGNQPALLKQFGHKVSYKLISYFIVPVFVAQTADLKLRCNMLRDGGAATWLPKTGRTSICTPPALVG